MSASPRWSVLVVDGEPTSRRFAELALARSGTFTVETAGDADGALEILRSQAFHAIVCDAELEDTNGLAFFRGLTSDSRTRRIPFLVWAADRDARKRVAAFRAGVDDYLHKPIDADEFAARLEGVIHRHQRTRDQFLSRAFLLAGNLGVMPLPDLVSLGEMRRWTGAFTLVAHRAAGRVYAVDGKVVHAECANLEGPAAFQRLFGETDGYFEFNPGQHWQGAPTIEGNATNLILEAAQRLDEQRRDNGGTPIEAATEARAPERLVALRPGAASAAQFESGLSDPFALGQLTIWSEENLARWTRREGDHRIHLVLVADLSSAVAATMAIAGAPTERWVMDSLSTQRRAFGLIFFLRRERIIDLVVLDARDPDAMLGSLQRAPNVMLVCPPRGNLLEAGVGARPGLERLINHLRPQLVLGLGDATLEQDLSGYAAFREHHSRLVVREEQWGSGGEDLRSLMIDAIARWGQLEGPKVAAANSG
jgi:CheY-like chemotaxis protein